MKECSFTAEAAELAEKKFGILCVLCVLGGETSCFFEGRYLP